MTSYAVLMDVHGAFVSLNLHVFLYQGVCPCKRGRGTLGVLGLGCVTGTLETLAYIPDLVQLNFATQYQTKLLMTRLS